MSKELLRPGRYEQTWHMLDCAAQFIGKEEPVSLPRRRPRRRTASILDQRRVDDSIRLPFHPR